MLIIQIAMQVTETPLLAIIHSIASFEKKPILLVLGTK